MKKRVVLVPTDFSKSGGAALQYAEALARGRGAELLIVHVKEPPPYFPPASHGVEDSGRGEENELLTKVKTSDPDIRHVCQILVGDPAEEIVRLADKVQVELIVMATHGRTGLSRLLMGSVAEAVVRQAKCPVLTIKQPLKEPSNAGTAS